MINKLYVARREKQLRQKDVAKAIGISEQTYYLKETGKRTFTIDEGLRLAKFYNCTLDDLFGDGEYSSSQQDNNDARLVGEITNHLDKIVKLLKNRG